MRGHPSIVLSYWSHFNIKLLGESCHCFFRKRKSLATTFGRPSRSDLVQLKFSRCTVISLFYFASFQAALEYVFKLAENERIILKKIIWLLNMKVICFITLKKMGVFLSSRRLLRDW